MHPLILSSLLLLLVPPSTPTTLTTSPAFHLLAIPNNTSLPISRLTTLHTGAGQNRIALSQQQQQQQNNASPNPTTIVFYQNATSSNDATILTDVLPQGFPLTIFLTPPGQTTTSPSEKGLAIDLTVSGSTPGLTVSVGTTPAADQQVPLLTYPGATFLSCGNETVGYLPGTYTVLNWLPEVYITARDEEGVEVEGCEVVDVVAVCDELGDLPQGALGTHEFVREVWCFDGEEGIGGIFGR